MPVPNIFGTATSAIPLSQLDTNFATPVTIGNTAVQLGNTVTSFGNVTLTNVTISSGNVIVTGANVSGTANVSTLVVTGNQTSLGNVAITGNISANIATFGAGSNTAPSITTVGDTNTGIFFPAADTIAFSEGGVEAMRIDSSANVGIGTSSPATGVHLQKASGNTYYRAQNNLTSTDFGTDSAGNGILWNNGNYPVSFGTNNTERARIDSSGNFTLIAGTQYFGMNQYTYKKWLQFNYAPSGQFGSNNDCTDFYTAGAAAADVNVQARLTQAGNLGLRGTLTNSATLNDYAEYFEWSDGNSNAEDRFGKSVVLDGNKIRLATSQDNAADIIGVVSATAGVALGCGALEWGGKYLRDELGRQLTQEVTYVIWNDGEARKYVQGEIPDDVAVPEDAVVRTYQEQILNPEFDENAAYQSRDNRPEWSAIGLMGQLRIFKGQPVGDRWRKMRDISETVEEWFVK
jgi:hypothetical protein